MLKPETAGTELDDLICVKGLKQSNIAVGKFLAHFSIYMCNSRVCQKMAALIH